MYTDVACICISLTESLSFAIDGFELSKVSIINNIASSSPALYRFLCVGAQGNRQLRLHVNTSGSLPDDPSSGMMPLHTINIQNYSAAIEVTIKTEDLPSLFVSTLTCSSTESGDNVYLILTSSKCIWCQQKFMICYFGYTIIW